jgi:hypothetical protein
MPDLTTAQLSFQNGVIVSANDTGFGGTTTSKWADTPADNAVGAGEHNGIDIAWTFGAPDQSVTCTIYAARCQGDYAQVWTGTLTAGNQVATDGRYYCDEITSSTKTWITNVIEVDSDGNNRMAHIMFDFCGYSNVVIQFGSISSESVRPIWAGY